MLKEQKNMLKGRSKKEKKKLKLNKVDTDDVQIQTFQLSRILRETHAFDIFLTLTRTDTIFSRKSEKIASDPRFCFNTSLCKQISYLAESLL